MSRPRGSAVVPNVTLAVAVVPVLGANVIWPVPVRVYVELAATYVNRKELAVNVTFETTMSPFTVASSDEIAPLEITNPWVAVPSAVFPPSVRFTVVAPVVKLAPPVNV